MNIMNRVLKINVFRKPTVQDTFYRYMSTNSLTRVSFSNGVKEITMMDVPTRNSLSLGMQTELHQHISSDWNNKDLRVIVLKSEGPVFSSGHNLKEFNFDRNKKQLLTDVFKAASKLMLSIIDCPVPVIACVNGVAAAAGCQLAAQCDIVVASEKSSFLTPGANFGVFCSTPGIPISRTVSRKMAMYMVVTGFPLSAQEAKSAGLVSVVCKEEQLKDEVNKICQVLIAKSRYVVHKGKQFFYEQVEMDDKRAYEMGEKEMCSRISEHDGQEGIKGFVEKRKPNWKHSS